jgi:hypothetical protein
MSGGGGPDAGTGGAGPDDEALEAIRERIEDLLDAAATVRELGAEHDIPAVERDAKRVEDVAATLDLNVPEELFGGERGDGSDRERGGEGGEGT